MKVLYFCPSQLWPTNTGSRLRNFHLSSALSQMCPVTLLQIMQPDEKRIHAAGAESYSRVISVEKDRSYTVGKVLHGLWGPVPLTVLNYSAQKVQLALEQTLLEGDFDLVQLVSIHLFSYLKHIRSVAPKARVLLDWHNIESELMERYAESTPNPAKKMVAWRTAGLLARYEQAALSECDGHLVVSQRERQKLMARRPNAKIHLVPNGVDTTSFSESKEQGQRRGLLFVGSMDYHANEEAVLWFMRETWPKLSRDFPTLTFTIAGRNPSSGVRALATERVIVTGTVDDVRQYYHQATAVVVPLRVGGGTRLKILEAMAAGVPVISTRLGAEGLEVRDDDNILLADTAEEMQAAIKRLLHDPLLSLRITEAGGRLVREQYDWAILARKLESVYGSLV